MRTESEKASIVKPFNFPQRERPVFLFWKDTDWFILGKFLLAAAYVPSIFKV